ncbi:MAG: hypothetical protein K2I99_03855 [Bacteroidaceae bacterium]|nr:hypothetical protein [Bacteroidaceae bacterium]
MLAIALLSIMSVKAQTFVCTDVTFSDYAKKRVDQSYRYQLKKRLLGSTCTIEVFDNNLKFEATDTEGNKEEYIYTKIGLNKYRFEDTMTDYDNYNYLRHTYNTWKLRTDIEIQTVFGYYSSITVKQYRDGNLLQTTTAKRKK